METSTQTQDRTDAKEAIRALFEGDPEIESTWKHNPIYRYSPWGLKWSLLPLPDVDDEPKRMPFWQKFFSLFV